MNLRTAVVDREHCIEYKVKHVEVVDCMISTYILEGVWINSSRRLAACMTIRNPGSGRYELNSYICEVEREM